MLRIFVVITIMCLATIGRAGWYYKAASSDTSVLKQSEEDALTDFVFANSTTTNEMVALSFQAASSYTLTRVDLYMAKNDTPTQAMTCRILAADGTPGAPVAASVLATATNTRSGTDIPAFPTPGWVQWDFTGLALTSGTYYYIQLSIPDDTGSTTNYYYPLIDNTGGSNSAYLKEFSAAWGSPGYSSVAGITFRAYGF